jgi:hypothetical protein
MKIKERMKRIYWKLATKQLDAVGVIEIILILVIIIGLVLIFRTQIVDIIQTAFESINGNSDVIGEEITITTGG